MTENKKVIEEAYMYGFRVFKVRTETGTEWRLDNR